MGSVVAKLHGTPTSEISAISEIDLMTFPPPGQGGALCAVHALRPLATAAHLIEIPALPGRSVKNSAHVRLLTGGAAIHLICSDTWQAALFQPEESVDH
jgi:hypothetical protein